MGNKANVSNSISNPINIIGYEYKCIEDKVIIEDENMCSITYSLEKDRNLKEEGEIESETKEMGEMKEENERLKKTVERIENDYKLLQTRFFDIFQHEQAPTVAKDIPLITDIEKLKGEEPETSLSLGLQSAFKRKKDGSNSTSGKAPECREMMSEGLSLGLEFKCTPEIDLTDIESEKSNENGDAKEDETEESNRPSKVQKAVQDCEKEEETRRARVSVRARCETPTMNDGCQWRKYGQKIAKGNPCPRAYYRCTVAPACPVRKQVQRCSQDMSILTTTYEGTHNHPLTVAATAMASTTSAAASILLSGSSTSQNPSFGPTTANLNGLNFTLYNNSKPGHLNLPNCPSPTPPTITLDLTTNSSSHFSKQFSSTPFPSHRYSRSLDFSSAEATGFPTAWNNPSYLSFGKSSQEQINLSYTDRITQSVASSSSTTSQQFLTDTLTKVLTADPSFQSAVAAAISNMVGNSNNNNIMSLRRTSSESLAESLKWREQVPGVSINSLPQNRPTSATLNTQTAGSFMLSQPTFPFSLSKTSSTTDLRDQLK